jgi:endonuclease/exonuclease/phosphatase (EEP) superfamily protein YafD
MRGIPGIAATIEMEGRDVKLFCIHASSPGDPQSLDRRNQQLEMLAELVRSESDPVIVVGDLNAVHWHDAFRELLYRTELRTATDPTFRTWPVIGPVALIPLDHLLISPHLSVTAIDLVEIPGSDHRGLQADIFIPDEQ